MASRRPDTQLHPLSAAVLAILTVISFAGCDAAGGYGPPRDVSRFVSAAATPDGTRGVFTYHRYVYRPAAGLRAFPDGGIPDYVYDDHSIGIYDFGSGSIEVVFSDENTLWTDGQGVPNVSRLTDGYALITRGGQLRDDLGSMHTEVLLLNLETKEITVLPLERELEDRGLEPGGLDLEGDDGTLVFVALPKEAAEGKPRWGSDESVCKEVWIRHPDGGYEKVADAIHYYGYDDGKIHYYPCDGDGYMVYDSLTGKRTAGRGNPPLRQDATVDLAVSSGGRGRLSIGRKGPDGWSYTDAGVDPALLLEK